MIHLPENVSEWDFSDWEYDAKASPVTKTTVAFIAGTIDVTVYYSINGDALLVTDDNTIIAVSDTDTQETKTEFSTGWEC